MVNIVAYAIQNVFWDKHT